MRTRPVPVMLLAAALACAAKRKRPSLERARAFAQAELRIERMRKKEAPDWSAVSEEYEATAGVVGEMDELWGTGYDADIRAALEQCARGEDPKVNQQVMAKGLQHVAVLAMMRELDAMAKADAEARRAAAGRVAAYFEGIRPTFVRRDGDYFAGTETLEAAAERAIERLSRAAETGGGEIIAARREFEDAIARTYALSVIYEVEEIEKHRDKDRALCAVKRREAQIFCRIIRPRVGRRDPKADETISAMLAGEYGAMSAKVIEENLKKGLPGVMR